MIITLTNTYHLPNPVLSHLIFTIMSGNFYNSDFAGVEIEAGEVKQAVSRQRLESDSRNQKKIEIIKDLLFCCLLCSKFLYVDANHRIFPRLSVFQHYIISLTCYTTILNIFLWLFMPVHFAFAKCPSHMSIFLVGFRILQSLNLITGSLPTIT